MMRVLIVDDEQLVRDAVRAALVMERDVEIVGEAHNGAEALEMIGTTRPDVVFLDVQMPGLTGVEVLSALPPAERPAVVFVTAHDQYAIRAFELNAADYVLKPFDDARIRAALARMRDRRATGQVNTLTDGLERLLTQLAPPADAAHPHLERFIASLNSRLRVIPVTDVEWIEAEDNYVRLHTLHGTALVRDTIKSVEARLDPRRFVRVHRSAIVALGAVVELRPLPPGDYEILMASGARVAMSRTHRDRVIARLSGETGEGGTASDE